MPNRKGVPQASWWGVSCSGCCEHQSLIRNVEQNRTLQVMDGSGLCGSASSEVRGTFTEAHQHT